MWYTESNNKEEEIEMDTMKGVLNLQGAKSFDFRGQDKNSIVPYDFNITVFDTVEDDDKITIDNSKRNFYGEKGILDRHVYVGDLCYAINDRHWQALCKVMFSEIGEKKDWGTFMHFVITEYDLRVNHHGKGTKYEGVMISTEHGDGDYRDQHKNRFTVDSGSVGVIDSHYIMDFSSQKGFGVKKGLQQDIFDEGVGIDVDWDSYKDFAWTGLEGARRGHFNVWRTQYGNDRPLAVIGSHRIRIG